MTRPSASTSVQSPRRASAAQILLVDDNEGSLLALEALLEGIEVFPVRARSAHEAFGQLLHGDFALIVLDVRLPDTDGFDVAQLIRRQPRHKDLPIIFVTGIDRTSEEVDRAYALGAVDFLFKPVSAEAFRSKVRTFMDLYLARRELERRVSERTTELEATATRLRLFAEQSPAIQWTTDADLRITMSVGSALASIGLQPGQLVGTLLIDAVGPNDPAVEAHRRALAGQSARYEGVYGDRRYESIVEPLRDEKGKIIGTVGLGLDRTEQKMAHFALQESERRLKEALSLARMVVWEWDVRNDRVTTSDNVAEIYGLGEGQDVAESASGFKLVDARDRDRHEATVKSAIAGKRSYTSRFRINRPKDGKTLWMEEQAHPVLDERGDVIRLTGIVMDVTARREAEESLAFLAEAGRTLASSLDYDVTIGKVAELAVREIADWCVVDMAQGQGLRRVAVAHRDPERVAWARRLHERYPEDANRPSGVAGVLRSGKPELYPEVTDEMLVAGARDEEHLRALREAGIHSVMLVPMSVSGRTVGVLTCISSDPARRYGEKDLALATALGERAALAAENAALYRERLRQKEHLDLLAESSRLFAESDRDLAGIMERLAESLIPGVADSCYVRRLSQDGKSVVTLAARHRDPEVEKRERELMAAPQPADQGMTGVIIRTGRPVFMPVIDDEEFRRSTAPQYRAYVGRGSMKSYMMVPMRARGKTLGALGVGRCEGRQPFTHEDLDLIQRIADRAALAVGTWEAFHLLEEEKAALARSREDLHRAEAASAFLAEVVRSSNDAVITKTLEGRITSWNAAAERIFGYSSSEAVGRSITIIIPEDRLHEEKEILAKLAHGESMSHFETVRRGKDGGLLDVSVTISPVKGPDGVVIGASKVARDITEQKRIREEIRKMNAELEERVRERTRSLRETIHELDSFAYTVAHDLRAPLRSVHSFGEMLLESAAPKLDATERGYLATMIRSGGRMDDLITDLLAYTRLTRQEVLLQELDPEPILDRILEEMRGELASKRIDLSVARPLPKVLANPVLLGQALANLISNAAKFVSPDRPPRIRIGAETGSTRVRLYVEDNGIGIAPQYHGKLFKIFERLHAGNQYSGTGIGLAIVRRAAERMSGAAGVESEEGKGSRFWLDLSSGGRAS